MTSLDIFIISFGIAFIVASDRFKRGLTLLRTRSVRARRR